MDMLKALQLRFLILGLILLGTGPVFSVELPQFDYQLFKDHGLVMLLIDPESGAIERANHAASRYYGYTVDELEQMQIQDINVLTPAEIQMEMQRAVTERHNYFVFQHRLADGSIRPVEVYSSPVVANGREILYSVIIDISGREELLERIAENEARMRHAERVARFGHWYFDLDTKQYRLSEGAMHVLGVDRTFLSLQEMWQKILPEDRDRVEQALHDLHEENEVHAIMFRVKRPDGKTIDLKLQTLYDATARAVIGVIQDVTVEQSSLRALRFWRTVFVAVLVLVLLVQLGVIFLLAKMNQARKAEIAARKRSEDSLRQSDDIIENMQIGLHLYEWEDEQDDRSLRLLSANDASGKLSGTRPEELIGGYIDEIFPGLRERGIPARYADIVRTGTSGEFEDLYYGDDGRLVAAYAVKAFPLPHQRVGVTFDNITEMKRTQDWLAQSEARYRSIIAVSNTGAWEFNKDDGYLWCSPEYFTMLGRDPDDYLMDGTANLDESWIDLIHPDDRESAAARFTAYLDGGSIGMYENHFRMRHQNGSWVWIWSRGQTLRDRDGRLTNLTVGTHIDITERKRAEAERLEFESHLHQTQRLESLGVLAGGIAHDFNNILMAIMGHADLVLDELSPLSPCRDSLSEIVASSKRAAELCTQMLAYAGRGQREQCDMSLGDLVEETLHMLKTSISKKAILHFNLEESLPCIHGDPAQIRQILMNLVINASDAIGARSGIITVSTGAQDCSEDYLAESYIVPPNKPETYVYIEVSDTGCGMDKKTAGRIFEPFFTTKFTGRGLGMSAVLGIVKAHEGALRVYTEKGKGSTFTVMFPAIDAGDASDSEDGVVEPWQGQGTILLVDDEESIRAISSKQLRRLGFDVVMAKDGKHAVQLYRERGNEINLVLLDLTMPHMNGVETYRALRQIDPGVRVILASGYSEHDVASQFAGKGLAGFLQKPYTLTKLRKLLSSIM